MKVPHLRLIAIAAILSCFSSAINSQNFQFQLSGPGELCVSECGFYTLEVDSNSNIVTVSWDVNGATTSTQNPFIFCPQQEGEYFISVVAQIEPNQFIDTLIFVEVVSQLQPEIISLSALCPDSLSACDQVCANSTATYQATGVSPSDSLVWTVIGAADYEINGTQITVDWGGPGQGKVIVNASAGVAGSPPMQLFCGQEAIDFSTPGGASGTGFVDILDAPGTVTITVSGPTGTTYSNSGSGSFHWSIANLVAGSYSVSVTGQNGDILGTCNFDIFVNDTDCWTTAFPVEFAHASSCDACDGFIQIQPTGGSQVQYTVQWNNGATGYAIQGLCPGIYTATITDALGCTAEQSFQIWCPASCNGSDELCVDILPEPEAQIGSTPAAANGTVEICQGQTIYFDNLSQYATSYAWYFGNGNTSAQFSPSQTYGTPGMYQVMLIARNSCFCADTSYLDVNVLPAAVPEIMCTGTVCEGESVTYSTDAMCGTYNWSISGNGSVLDGGGPSDNYVTVLWNQGPEGLVSLGVSGCSGSVCTTPNEVPIPIVSDLTEIQGDDQVCQDSEEEYYIPDFHGTAINWSVVGSGLILDGQGTDRITVSWYGDANQGNPQLVIVEFENCYLGCGGRDTLEVNIVPEFYVEGPIEVCQNATGAFTSRNALTGFPMSSNWQVLDASGTQVWASGGAATSVSIPFNFTPGTYTVRAEPAGPGFCNDRYDIFVKVLALPAKPLGITGATEICPGTSYTYLASGNNANDYTWTAYSGTNVQTINGNPVVVTWGASGPYTLAVAQVATTGLGCVSDTLSIPVDLIPDFGIIGEPEVCLYEQTAYLVPTFENIDYQWSISPAGAGSFVAGQGTEAVSIQWNQPGAATVSVTICGNTRSFAVDVLPLPQPEVTAGSVCAGQTVTVTTTQPFATYFWKDEQGNSIGLTPSVDIAGGYYEVEVTDANGCMGDTTFFIDENPNPTVSISTPSYYALCSGGPAATIYATSQSGMSYQWFQDGSPVGGNNPTYSTNSPGFYWVVVTDANGCTATSNQLELVDCEAIGGTCVGGLCYGAGGGPPLPSCTPAGTVDFNPIATADCDSIFFDNLSTNYVPGSFTWLFDDPASGLNNSSTDFEPSHVFSGPGYYTVILIGEVNAAGGGTCQIGVFKDLVIPAVADFTVASACPMAPTLFEDNSQFVAGETITGWSWDFGDPGSGAANFSTAQNPSHVYPAPGNYDVTLTITMAGGCQTSVTKTIEVKPLPTLSIDMPIETCENTAIPFSAVVSQNVAEVEWDFGDPASGSANSSTALVSFHSFATDGNYNITLTATTIAGCSDSYTEMFTVTPNTLAGNITANPPPPICEGDQTILTAPAGGQIWLWSNGFPTEQITVNESGVFDVTVTTLEGCTYNPPPFVVEVTPEPNAILKAVEYNEFGQPVAFHEGSLSVCDGDDVTLFAFGQLSYSYTWSDGSLGSQVDYTSDKGNLLPVGTHNFSVTVTDLVTGCTSVEGPFTVTVNPNPDVAITSVPSGFICENTTATLSVDSPDPSLIYQWNTGETTTDISVVAGGDYFVEATNSFGCSTRSNIISLHNAPDPDLVPGSCHTRCDPDTMCLPPIPNVASYQWLLDGNPIPAPNGTLANPVFDQSGTYQVVMTDIFGCTSTSEPLTLDLQPGFGEVLGDVWYDVNGNNVIDPADTLLPGIPVVLISGGSPLDTMISLPSGNYVFGPIGAQSYYVAVDTANLPAGYIPIIFEGNVDLIGCDVQEQVDFLLTKVCLPTFASLNLSACEGDSAFYQGIGIPAGTQDTVTLTNVEGCDSLVVVTVDELLNTSSSVTLSACQGDSVMYMGINWPAGQTGTITLANAAGCDSVISVSVTPIPSSSGSLTLTACEGDTVMFMGMDIPVGQSATITLTNYLGCDSLLTVTVDPLLPTTGSTTLTGCEGDTVSFMGVDIPVGQSATITLTNYLGCDSLLTVNVDPLPPSESMVNLSACPGDSATYQGLTIPAGETDTLFFTNYQGCDSLVIIDVLELGVDTTMTELSVCSEDSVLYNGQYLYPGDVVTFTLSSSQGCDSLVEVSAVELPHTVLFIDAVACENSFFEFNGQAIYPGEEAIFTATNLNGCLDSTIVAVLPLPVDTNFVQLSACDGESVLYNGQLLPAGSEQVFNFTNQYGCDSVVTVAVASVPAPTFDLLSDTVCWNDTDATIEVVNVSGGTPPWSYSLDGVDWMDFPVFKGLTGGTYTVFVANSEGCESQQTTTLPTIGPMSVEAPDLFMNCGDNLPLQPVVASPLPYTFTWQDGTTEQFRLVDTPGTYYFSVSNACETLVDSVVVALEDKDGEFARVYVPNAFSPNNDGINDCFRGHVEPGLEVLAYEMKIFDRWGDLIFETTEIDGCWDGTFKGKVMDPAVFVWYIRYTLQNCAGETGEVFREGGVHLMR
ncbi:MAG: hypothetical protein Kow0027_04290 [Saprospiraceae bacterium]